MISGVNAGQDAAVNAVVTDSVPANTRFVPGSLSGGLTDVAGDDRAELDAGAGRVVFRLGGGATATTGGRLAPGEGFEVRYRVRVAAGTPSGTAIVNQASIGFLADTLGLPVERETNRTGLTTSAPDLAMNKSFGIVALGTYAFTVTNVGDAPTRGSVVITDEPPNGIVTVVDPGGFACTAGAALRCQRSDSLAPGQSWVVTATISAPLPSNTAVVSGGDDVNQSNDTDTIFLPQPSLAVEKTVTPDSVAPGERVTYMVTVGNRSSATPASSVRLSDTVSPGLAVESVDALDQGICDATVSCSLGTVAPGGLARVRIVGRVGHRVGPGKLSNSASVTGPLDDSRQGDNTDSATFGVRRTARLEITKRLDGTPRAGRPVSWTASVRNLGPHDSSGGTLADKLPDAVAEVSASVPGGSCTTAGKLLGCTLPPIAAGGSVDVSISGTLRRGTGGDAFPNGVQIVAPPAQAPPAAASTPADEVVRPAADVGVAKVATPAPAARRGRLIWHVRTTNHGPSTATKVVVRDLLPDGARFAGSVPTRRCDARGRRVTCRIGRLRAGRAAEFDIRVRLRAARAARSLTNRISVHARQPDQAAANNRDRSAAPLAPRLVLRKSAGRRRARVRDTLTYRLRLTNRGPGTATRLVLCDRPGRGLALRRAPGGRRGGRGACWRIGRLAKGRSVTRRAIASVVKGAAARRVNRASVRIGGARVAAARVAVRVRRAQPGACPASAPFGRTGPVAGPAC